MTSSVGSNGFAAKMLESSARALAAYAAEQLLEADPSLSDRSGEVPFEHWKTQIEGRVRDLANALEAGEPVLFQANLDWQRSLLGDDTAAVRDLFASLDALKRVVAEELPAAVSAASLPVIDRATEIRDPSLVGKASAIDPNLPHGTDSLQYLEFLLTGQRDEAIDLIEGLADAGVSLSSVYDDVLRPAQTELGRLWTGGSLSVTLEHFGTQTTELAMAQLYRRRIATPRLGKTVLACSVETDQHSIGIRMIADLFEVAGWKSVFLGADVPAEDIAQALIDFKVDVLAVSGTLPAHVVKVRTLIDEVRRREETKTIPVLIGGLAFRSTPDLWRSIGADGYADGAESAIKIANSLIERSG